MTDFSSFATQSVYQNQDGTVRALHAPTISCNNFSALTLVHLFGPIDTQVQLTSGTNQIKFQPYGTGNNLFLIGSSPAVADRHITLADPGADVNAAYVYTGGLVKTAETVIADTTSAAAADILNGIITVTTAGGPVSFTLPTAATLVAAVPNASVGDVIKCLIVSNGANIITLVTATGLTLLSVPIIPAQTSRVVYFRFTDVTVSAEAVAVY